MSKSVRVSQVLRVLGTYPQHVLFIAGNCVVHDSGSVTLLPDPVPPKVLHRLARKFVIPVHYFWNP